MGGIRAARPPGVPVSEGVAEQVAFAGLSPWEVDGQWRHRRLTLGPDTCIEGTDRPLTGVLFAWLDVVTGSPPSGDMNPTVDLQVRLFSVPRCGVVDLRARTLRLGRTLYVGEVEMHQDGTEGPVGVALATFMNQPVPFPNQPDPAVAAQGGDRRTRYSALTGARRLAPGTLELDVDLRTPQGTVGGATLGRLAELAALDLLGNTAGVDELDLRFLNKVKVGPIRAAATVLGRREEATTVRIEISDVGGEDRLVTYALAVCRPLAHA